MTSERSSGMLGIFKVSVRGLSINTKKPCENGGEITPFSLEVHKTRKSCEHCVENKEADKSTQRDPFRLFRLCLLVM